MEGIIIRIWSLLIGALIVWTGVQFHVTGSPEVGAPNYPLVSFNAAGADASTYGEMISSLRRLLTDGTYSHGIPVLRNRANVPDTERYILLNITTYKNQFVTFAIDVTNVYIVGYRVGGRRYFFNESASNAHEFLFTDITGPLPERRSSGYPALESRAGTSRTSINLGLHALADAITTLSSRPEDPRSVIIVLQMIAEAIRYWEIETRVRRSPLFLPDAVMIDLENSWEALSQQIQRSDNFEFERPITIGDRVADNINSYVIAGLYLMIFICQPRAGSLEEPQQQLLLMSVALFLAPPAAAAASSAVFLGPAAAATTCSVRSCGRRRSGGGRGRMRVVAMADLLGDFGARDPFPEEIESNFGEKVLGNVDTLHRILIPTLSVLSLARVPLEPGAAAVGLDDARKLLHKVVGWRLILSEDNERPDRLQCIWKVRDEACGQELIARINRALDGSNHPPVVLVFEAPNQVRAELSTPSAGGLTVNDYIVAARIDQVKTLDLIPKKRVWA